MQALLQVPHRVLTNVSCCAKRRMTCEKACTAGETERPLAWIMTISREMTGSTSCRPLTLR